MNGRRTILVQALLAAVVLAVLQLLIIYYVTRQLFPTWAELVAGIAALIATAGVLFWISGRIRDVCKSGAGVAGDDGLSHSIATGAAKWATWGILALVVLVAVAIALLVPDTLSFPLQPLLTFTLSAIWFAYIIISLNHLVSVEGGSPQELARFARNSVITAIALSIYFAFPFDWFVERGFRAYELLTLGQASGKTFSLSVASPAVLWLESTAIPSVVALAFGVLVAYVSSLVWYEFYQKIRKAGVVNILASRQGREPQQDDFWFGSLRTANARAILCGATLGGWFAKWDKLRPALLEVIGRETVQQVKIILPEPGSDAFWVRRNDETGQEKSLSHDPVARLTTAIETLYLMLPEGPNAEPEFDQVAKFLDEQHLPYQRENLKVFHEKFTKTFAGPRYANYAKDAQNLKFSQTLASSIKAHEAEPLRKKFSVIFCRGTILAADVFDNRVLLVPYLPGTDDKDCPQFEIGANSELGASLDRAIGSVSAAGVWITTKPQLIGIAFRLWARCQQPENKEEIRGLPGIPAWLLFVLGEEDGSINPRDVVER